MMGRQGKSRNKTILCLAAAAALSAVPVSALSPAPHGTRAPGECPGLPFFLLLLLLPSSVLLAGAFFGSDEQVMWSLDAG